LQRSGDLPKAFRRVESFNDPDLLPGMIYVKKFSEVAGRLAILSLVLSLTLAAVGCGEGGGGAAHIRGKVTYDGKPVPQGTITFSPDTAKGNSGPGSMAVIKDGRYDTKEGLGIIGGPHVVRIEGFDGVADGDNLDGALLFPSYRTEVDLPTTSGEVDFEVK